MNPERTCPKAERRTHDEHHRSRQQQTGRQTDVVDQTNTVEANNGADRVEATDLSGVAVAVIGVGTMGSAMARRLLSAGATVSVWDRSERPLLELEVLGARANDNPRHAAANASVVISILPTGDVSSAVMIDQGVIDSMAPGAIWAQMGTVGIAATVELDSAVRARRLEVHFVDAPVSGSRGPAESGQLVVLGSGPSEARSVVDPIFSVLGRRTLWLGPAGAGSKMKLVLNTWLAFEIEAAAEALALGTRLGIEPSALSDALDDSALVSSFAANKLAKMQAADDEPDFSLTWALKDLDLAGQSAEPEGLPVASAIAERWRNLVDHMAIEM